ncbi:MAG TPA: response regulator transcription factor [bacterium]|nr:response regulator transcription factor [bacterium]
MEKKNILLLMDRNAKTKSIEHAFIRSGFEVFCTMDVRTAINNLRLIFYQAMIVDWDFVGEKMKKLTSVIQNECSQTALILITENKKTDERIVAMENGGADDCFHDISEADELVAKVKAIVRRIDMVGNTPKILKIKDIEINLDSQAVHKNQQYLDLTYTQFKLLYLLASKRDYVFSREEILEKVWGKSAFVTDRTVDVHVKRLREKLGGDGNNSQYIQTIHGLGYRFA